MTTRECRWRCLLLMQIRCQCCWKVDDELRTFPEAAFDSDEASALLDDSGDDRQTKAGALAFLLRRKERFEKSCFCRRIHSSSGIYYRQGHKASWFYASPLCFKFPYDLSSRRNPQF